ncbi:MAG TPA: iron-containing alcohol dehydrogenase [Acetobacteraceae bacterium]|nr:iron-containing alcohol dehydrogenase [Acetobacteraceae bacterium]
MTAQGVYQNFAIDRVVYGKPAAETLVTEAARLGAKRVFLVVSRTLDNETTWVNEMRTVLGARYAGSFDGVPSHTPRQSVLDATAQAREVGADLIVTFGGGSGTDAGKMIRLALKHDIRAVEDFDRFVVRVAPDGSRALLDYAAPDVPQIAIPTTLSGGDFNPSAGATDTRTMLKEIFRHPRLVPSVIVLDPAVTVRTPQWLWLSSGIRALDHAVETVCAPAADARSRLEAVSAITLLARALPRTHQDPNDLGARMDAQLAVWLSMEHNRFGISMGASHGIGHVLGGTCNVPHGYTSCVMLPPVLRYNESANGDRQAMVAEAFGRPNEPAWRVVHEFVASLGLPRSLAEVGVTGEKFETVAKAAMLDHYLHTNPRPIHGVSDIMDVLRMAA